MSIEQALLERSNAQCELCGSDSTLSAFDVPPISTTSMDKSILLCETCQDQVIHPDNINANHWRCLNDSMWSSVPAVQVMAWRQLKQLSSEIWAQDLLEILYLNEETQAWAEAIQSNNSDDIIPSFDSNGATLLAGDNVTLIKDLDVKGAGFTAKRGTMVKNISLTNNPEQIEGRVNGTRIVLLTKFLKKA
ncbi:MAG: PhnA domain-containing protein [Piscirickettsiaceae bacterium]|nr:PhnA domain-containing protein [Piscirickettsiaceae bacterium]